MRILEGGARAATVVETVGQGVLFTALAGAVAFAIGFGFWFGLYMVEWLVSG